MIKLAAILIYIKRSLFHSCFITICKISRDKKKISRHEKEEGISVQNDKNKDSATELSMTMTDPLYIHRGRRKGIKSEGMRRELV